MSNTTEKLNLIKPELTDLIHQTILDLAANFQKLSDVAEIYMNNAPTQGLWIVSDRVWKLNPQIGDYAGWINTRQGRAAPVWHSLYAYNTGDYMVPNVDNGHVYKCVQSGRSGVLEPTFPVTANAQINDVFGSDTWKPSHAYELNEIVVPTMENGRFYVCTVNGLSGTSEPTWSLVDGATVSDNMAVWTGYRIVKWEEQGTASLFRPFGKID